MHFNIPALSVAYKDKIQLGPEQPIRLDYVAGVLTIQIKCKRLRRPEKSGCPR